MSSEQAIKQGGPRWYWNGGKMHWKNQEAREEDWRGITLILTVKDLLTLQQKIEPILHQMLQFWAVTFLLVYESQVQ